MKFTKDDARKELVAKMTARGEKLNLSERSINEQLEALIPLIANDETELSDFVEKVLPLLKTADANVRNDISVGINKYKEENPLQQAKREETTPKVDEPNGELLKRLALMEEKLAKQELEEKERGIRNAIISKLREKGVNDDDWSNALVSEIHITDEFNVDEKVESYLKLYNKTNSRVSRGASPEDSSGGGKQSDRLAQAIQEAANLAKSQRLID